MIRMSAFLAVVFGLFLIVVEIVRNWGDWPAWPFWLVDVIAAGVLIWGALRTLRRGSSRLLSAAWGFTAGVFWMSFFSHTEAFAGGGPGVDGPAQSLGVMLLVAIDGLLMSLARRTI